MRYNLGWPSGVVWQQKRPLCTAWDDPLVGESVKQGGSLRLIRPRHHLLNLREKPWQKKVSKHHFSTPPSLQNDRGLEGSGKSILSIGLVWYKTLVKSKIIYFKLRWPCSKVQRFAVLQSTDSVISVRKKGKEGLPTFIHVSLIDNYRQLSIDKSLLRLQIQSWDSRTRLMLRQSLKLNS